MRTGSGLLRFIVVGMVLLLAVSVGAFLLFRAPATPPQDPADVNAIYQVVGEFGARLKDVPNDSLQDLETMAAKENIGVRMVNGVEVFHTRDGRNLELVRSSDSSRAVRYGNETLTLESALRWELSLAAGSQTTLSAGDDSLPYMPPIPAVSINLKRLITPKLYQADVADASIIPGRPVAGPWPDGIQIDSMQKLDSVSYLVTGKIILMTNRQAVEGGSAGARPVTLTVRKVDGTWLVDEVR